MKKRVIFGTGKIAEVLHYYFTYESPEEVVAFTADKQYTTEDTFLGLPIVPFESVEQHYPPTDYDVFVAVGYQEMNQLRKSKVEEAKAKGYTLKSYIHLTTAIPKDLKLGNNCFIMSQANIHPCVTLGDNVFVWSGAMIGHHSKIGSHTWITSSANIGGNVVLGESCFLAMGATIAHSITLGKKAFIGANTLVTKSLQDEQVVITESNKPIRLTSAQFIRMTGFNTL